MRKLGGILRKLMFERCKFRFRCLVMLFIIWWKILLIWWRWNLWVVIKRGRGFEFDSLWDVIEVNLLMRIIEGEWRNVFFIVIDLLMVIFMFLILCGKVRDGFGFDFVVMLNLFCRGLSFLYFGLVLSVRRRRLVGFLCSFNGGINVDEFGLDLLHKILLSKLIN